MGDTINLHYSAGLSGDTENYEIQYEITGDDDAPIAGAALTQAFFRVFEGTKRRLDKTLDDLAYDPQTGVLSGPIMNSELAFLKDGLEYTFAFGVVVSGEQHILDEGFVLPARYE